EDEWPCFEAFHDPVNRAIKSAAANNSFHPTDFQSEIASEVKENSSSRRRETVPFAIVRIVLSNCSGRQHGIELWNCIQSSLHKGVGVWTGPGVIIAVCSKFIILDH